MLAGSKCALVQASISNTSIVYTKLDLESQSSFANKTQSELKAPIKKSGNCENGVWFLWFFDRMDVN